MPVVLENGYPHNRSWYVFKLAKALLTAVQHAFCKQYDREPHRRVEFCELLWKHSRRRPTATSDTEGGPRLLHLKMHDFRWNVLYRAYRDNRLVESLWICLRNALCTAVIDSLLAICKDTTSFPAEYHFQNSWHLTAAMRTHIHPSHFKNNLRTVSTALCVWISKYVAFSFGIIWKPRSLLSLSCGSVLWTSRYFPKVFSWLVSATKLPTTYFNSCCLFGAYTALFQDSSSQNSECMPHARHPGDTRKPFYLQKFHYSDKNMWPPWTTKLLAINY